MADRIRAAKQSTTMPPPSLELPLTPGAGIFDPSIDAEFWVPYSAAERAFARMRRLANSPIVSRTACLMIEAPTNHGKTQIAMRFKAVQEASVGPGDGEMAVIPVIRFFAPPGSDRRLMLLRMIEELGAQPVSSRDATALQNQLVHLLRRTGTRLILIDEFHQMLTGSAGAQTAFLGVLKDLINETQIPVVVFGLREATRALQTDQQLGNRFDVLEMPLWEPNESFARFAGCVWMNWFPEDSELFESPTFIQRLHAETEGLTGEVVKRLRAIAYLARIEGVAALTEKLARSVPWTPPSRRRAGIG